MDVEKSTVSLLKNLLEGSVKFVKKNALYIVDDYLRLRKDRVIVYDPARGEIEFEIFFPVDLPTLQTVNFNLDLTTLKESLKKAQAEIEAMIPEIDWDYSIWDTYYKYKPSMDVANWVPPFKSKLSHQLANYVRYL